MPTRAVIVDAVRSPMGRGKSTGALAGLHPADLLAQVLSALVERSSLDPVLVDDVLIGCVGQAGEQSATPGRQALLAAGWPTSVPSVTIERKCGSGQQAVEFAAAGIVAGLYDIAVAGGVESMSRVPMGSARMGADPFGAGVRERFPVLVPQGVSAELVAQKWNLSRAQLDEYAARSHARAEAARVDGGFKDEIVPVRSSWDGGAAVTEDETIRAGTTVERLGELAAAFGTDDMVARFPDVEWKVTAGNSSQITDGAAALLLMSEEKAAELGLRPRARILASSVCGDDPTLMLTGPIPATHRVLERAGIGIDEVDAVEVNEAFASVPLAWQDEFGVAEDRLNPRGGAIALGHPLGASGARLMTTLINHLEATAGRFGLQTMCEAGGMANATLIERI
jgi:acetyl-CoA acyltransferase